LFLPLPHIQTLDPPDLALPNLEEQRERESNVNTKDGNNAKRLGRNTRKVQTDGVVPNAQTVSSNGRKENRRTEQAKIVEKAKELVKPNEAKKAKKAKKAKEAEEAEEIKKAKEAEEAEEIKKAKEAKEAKNAKKAKEAEEAEEAKKVEKAKKAQKAEEAKEAKAEANRAKDVINERKRDREKLKPKDARAKGNNDDGDLMISSDRHQRNLKLAAKRGEDEAALQAVCGANRKKKEAVAAELAKRGEDEAALQAVCGANRKKKEAVAAELKAKEEAGAADLKTKEAVAAVPEAAVAAELEAVAAVPEAAVAAKLKAVAAELEAKNAVAAVPEASVAAELKAKEAARLNARPAMVNAEAARVKATEGGGESYWTPLGWLMPHVSGLEREPPGEPDEPSEGWREAYLSLRGERERRGPPGGWQDPHGQPGWWREPHWPPGGWGARRYGRGPFRPQEWEEEPFRKRQAAREAESASSMECAVVENIHQRAEWEARQKMKMQRLETNQDEAQMAALRASDLMLQHMRRRGAFGP